MHTIHILLVEDNDGDILLTKEAFQDSGITNAMSVVKNGTEAIDFLSKKGKYKNAYLPDLLLLDINLPKKNGIEVLHYIKVNEDLKHIPVIMLTTSSSEKDVNLSYKNYANCFITKPAEVDSFFKVVSRVEDFWVSTVQLPTYNRF